MKREDLNGTWAIEREQEWPSTNGDETNRLALEYGLESAATIRDRTLPLFNRNRRGYGNFSRFLGSPFLQDMRELGGQDVAFLGVPLDTGTTYRPGTRFGPDAMRRISSLGSTYNVSMGVDLYETLKMADLGDVTVIPANIEKSFDQIALAIGYVHERAVFPVVLGGDHSIGYPDIRGIAPHIDGNIGIIHFDRHSDLSEFTWDERMHGSPFFHATNIENAPATNLVQIGIGGWTGSREGLRNARDRQATVVTLEDVDRYGIDKVAEYALEIAWHNAKAVFLSFDIDSVDPAFAPGTGTPEPGGFLPRELLKFLRLVTREGLAGMEVVEVSPPYDVSDITALLGTRAIMEVLGTLVVSGKLGRMPENITSPKPEPSSDDE
ncbi:MAG TPA: agmatinase [Nitrolancea sp.]|jgi:agmatinase|nr:agmatinase [Nitrolancea sp.]